MRSKLILILLITPLRASISNPLSKIDIESDKATLSKISDLVKIKYVDNVSVKLADGSLIKSQSLTVLIDELSKKPSVKTIIFDGNVSLQQVNRSARSNKIEVYPDKKECKLIGNVSIEQKKENDNDIPLKTTSNVALLNLNNNEVSFIGSKIDPVKTTIKVEGHPALKKYEQNKHTTKTRSSKNRRWRSR